MNKLYFKHLGCSLLFLTGSVFSTKAQTSLTYSYTGSIQSFTVPTCVTSITIDARGSKGGDCIYNQGGTKPEILVDLVAEWLLYIL